MLASSKALTKLTIARWTRGFTGSRSVGSNNHAGTCNLINTLLLVIDRYPIRRSKLLRSWYFHSRIIIMSANVLKISEFIDRVDFVIVTLGRKTSSSAFHFIPLGLA